MPEFSFNNVRIAAISCSVPTFIQRIDVANSSDPEQVRAFQKQTGFKERHISLTEQTVTDLAYPAALKALEVAGWKASSLDAVIFLSQTPDFNPGTGNAFIMHYRLGLTPKTLAYDITLGCASFPAGLATCCSLIQQKGMRRILMLTGDAHWHFYNNREELLGDNRFIHGEGVTAMLLEKEQGYHMHMALFTDGAGYRFLFNPIVGVRNAWRRKFEFTLPEGSKVQLNGRVNYMDGIEITQFSTITVVESLKKWLEAHQLTLDDYDGLVLHQANMQILRVISRRLKVPMDKIPVSLDRYANTSGASPTLTLCDAYAGDTREKLRLLTCAFGIGLAWGFAEIELEPAIVAPIFTSDERFGEFLL